MNPIEEYPDVLQNIEFAAVRVWQKHPEVTNYSVMWAYDAAIAYYQAIARGQAPKPVNLTGLDAKVFAAVQEICEWRLGRTPAPKASEVTPLAVEDLVACLKRLRKSVDFCTREGGRQGYLQHIQKFLP